MFGSIGMPELLVIMLLILILFGPKRIPELARALGRSLNELRRAAEDVKQELQIDDKPEPSKFQRVSRETHEKPTAPPDAQELQNDAKPEQSQQPERENHDKPAATPEATKNA